MATDLLAPDYIALARAFHAESVRVTTPEELSQAIQNATKHAGPTVIEAPCCHANGIMSAPSSNQLQHWHKFKRSRCAPRGRLLLFTPKT
ncbi:thiamine pyrophosphate-dependent enzyme [Dictyobacter kobayashii]|uniref:thiamine pyrophosphate-dependent enzyme n=1 Tax=Dictyobacter kobayashii TaxID=2014872 RepID=UPI002483231C|nr:thiamine pyrophosphate-dependent enzyme [Dictyobacter kobayashii]